MTGLFMYFQGSDVKLVAYNGDHFDFSVLRTEVAVHNIDTHGLLMPKILEDPVKRCKKLMGMRGIRRPKLIDVCKHLGVRVDEEQLHDAMGDAIALMEVMQKLDGWDDPLLLLLLINQYGT